jgi:carboxylesterase type B
MPQGLFFDLHPANNTSYACPQIFPDHAAGGGPHPSDPEINAADEFNCLILQLNIPLSILQNEPAQKLPVLVYIHGGGFVLGKIDTQHSTALMVQQSLTTGAPLISASIQYRLGALGYLQTSPSDSNLALNDQRNALLWIQKFVSGFGGDEKKVTVFGESAGSISICYHMLRAPPSSGPLFERAVLMSGIIGPTTAPCSREDAEARYEAFLKRLGIEERGDKGLEKLREVNVDEIVKVTAEMGEEGGMWLAVRDEDWFGKGAESVTWDRVPELIGQCEWVGDVMIGCTSFEVRGNKILGVQARLTKQGTTFASRYADVKPDSFLSSIKDQLGEENAQTVANAYNITRTMDQNLFLTSLLRWVGDAIFDAPTHMLASHLSTKTSKNIHRYVFNVRNPFPNNALYQQPHHWVDVYFVFKAHQFRFPSQRLKDVSTKHAQLWIDFANGKKPWAEYVYNEKGNAVVMFADEREGWVEKSVGDAEKELEWGYRRCEELVGSWEGMKGEDWAPLDLECLRGVKKT